MVEAPAAKVVAVGVQVPPWLSVQLRPVSSKLLVLVIDPEMLIVPVALLASVHDLVTVSPGGAVQVCGGLVALMLSLHASVAVAVTVSALLQVVGV